MEHLCYNSCWKLSHHVHFKPAQTKYYNQSFDMFGIRVRTVMNIVRPNQNNNNNLLSSRRKWAYRYNIYYGFKNDILYISVLIPSPHVIESMAYHQHNNWILLSSPSFIFSLKHTYLIILAMSDIIKYIWVTCFIFK